MIPCRDFDFEFGTWTVRHRRLKERLCGSHDWEEFGGRSTVRPILGGNGNIEENEIDFPGGGYQAIALRGHDPAQGTWAIWWLDARNPNHLDAPVIGRFHDGVGTFLADDVLRGQPIKVRFLWLDTASAQPRWEQAFSADAGLTWETNWQMTFSRSTG
ncbi:MAG: DUF1579 domain-containing protein [Gemmobacter sp.]